MAYDEWIRLGRDPVFPPDFFQLTRADARSFLRRVINVTPERLKQLESLIAECRPGVVWRPDFSEDAFTIVADVFTESVQKAPRDPSEIARDRLERPKIFEAIDVPVRDWIPTDRTLSIAFDAAIYAAQDLISKEGRLVWQIDKARTSITRNQPELQAPNPKRKPPFLSFAPFDLFLSDVLNIGNNTPRKVPWIETYRYWLATISWYKAENPEQ